MASHVQNTMQVPDELLALFSRNLTFSAERPAAGHRETAQPPPPPPPTYLASQHYTHSYHIARPRRHDVDAPASAAAQNQATTSWSSSPPDDDVAVSHAEAVLRIHGVETRLLTPSQLQLFLSAADAQKLRLVQLWSICPPDGAHSIPALAWSSTSLEQEEHLAHVRYQRDQLLREHAAAAAAAASQSVESEPYMAAGYEQLRGSYPHFDSAYNKAVDPIYLGPDFVREQQMEMASQYGAFEQMCADAMDVM